MKALLDTNVISELRKVHTGRVDARFLAWVKAANVADFYLSAIKFSYSWAEAPMSSYSHYPEKVE